MIMITAKEMVELEAKAGVPVMQLMENAGKALASAIQDKGKKFLIVCYHGNNGGDGIVAAKYLSDADVLFVGDASKLKPEAKHYYSELEKSDVQLFEDASMVDFRAYDVIVDALLGTGTAGGLKEPLASIVDAINGSGKYIVAVDVPTGMHPDTGEVVDNVVDADLIVCFHDIKTGLVSLKNKVVIVDIGITV